MRAKFMRELAESGLPPGNGAAPAITDADLEDLPAPARSYLRFMGVVGRPRDWSFRGRWTGFFRTGPGRPWMACRALQYNSRLAVARIFHLRLRIAGVVPLLARDTYVGGKGRMLVRLLDRLTLADGHGPEFDLGELVTYLDDAILIAPSMVLGPETVWTPVDDRSFDVTLADHGNAVTARVSVDERGAPTTVSTTDRYCEDPLDPKRLIRARWATPVEGYRMVAGRPLPTRGRAVWEMPSGPFAYADFLLEPESLAFNVPPGA